ncbi:MAG: hypothetical protein CMB56_006525 [Methanobacteriota archaeon]|nr:MAG: hypothetical protein CMB56_006525 [Euryarchaeota archaeon]
MRKKYSLKIEDDEFGVSPVIATILMVAITVVLSGVLYVWASELAGNQVDAGSLNTYSVEGVYSPGDNAESDTLLRMSFTNGPDDLQWSFLTVTLYDESSGQTYKCTPNGDDNCAINEETKDDTWQGNEIITLSENGVDICGESTTCELKVGLQYKGKTIAGQSGVITVNVGTGVSETIIQTYGVITWGYSTYGGDSSAVSEDLSSGVVEIFSTKYAFAALKDDGSVVTWGAGGSGDSSAVSEDLSSGVVEIFSSQSVFAALKDDGSVVTWGYEDYGGDSSAVSEDLSSGVVEIFSTHRALAALKDDGSVVAWGEFWFEPEKQEDLNSGVVEIFSARYAFAALVAE